MTHKSVRLLPKAVDLAAMQDTLPRESHASVPSSSGEHDARALNQGSFLPPLRGSLVLPEFSLHGATAMPTACRFLLGPNADITLQVTT